MTDPFVVMWTCPKCKESIDDQFDSCWKCAGAEQSPAPVADLFWMYPVISVASLAGLSSVSRFFWHSPRHAMGYSSAGGALLGFAISWIVIWAFLRCPIRHTLAKILTFVCLVAGLLQGIILVGSFFIHLLGYDAV